MKFNPKNRYILLGDIPQSKEENEVTILLPEEYTMKTNPHGVYQIQQFSTDCTKISLEDVGKLVVVNDSMVETASLDQGDFLLVLENHIYGVLEG